MKKFVFAALIMSLFGTVSAQTKNSGKVNPPTVVVKAFAKEFAGASHAKWEKEDANFEVDFSQSGKEGSAVYDVSGNLLETEWEIPMSELPKPVIDYLAVNYKGAKVKEAAKIIIADGTTEYEAEVKGKELIFDATGKLINQQK